MFPLRHAALLVVAASVSTGAPLDQQVAYPSMLDPAPLVEAHTPQNGGWEHAAYAWPGMKLQPDLSAHYYYYCSPRERVTQVWLDFNDGISVKVDVRFASFLLRRIKRLHLVNASSVPDLEEFLVLSQASGQLSDAAAPDGTGTSSLPADASSVTGTVTTSADLPLTTKLAAKLTRSAKSTSTSDSLLATSTEEDPMSATILSSDAHTGATSAQSLTAPLSDMAPDSASSASEQTVTKLTSTTMAAKTTAATASIAVAETLSTDASKTPDLVGSSQSPARPPSDLPSVDAHGKPLATLAEATSSPDYSLATPSEAFTIVMTPSASSAKADFDAAATTPGVDDSAKPRITTTPPAPPTMEARTTAVTTPSAQAIPLCESNDASDGATMPPDSPTTSSPATHAPKVTSTSPPTAATSESTTTVAGPTVEINSKPDADDPRPGELVALLKEMAVQLTRLHKELLGFGVVTVTDRETTFVIRPPPSAWKDFLFKLPSWRLPCVKRIRINM